MSGRPSGRSLIFSPIGHHPDRPSMSAARARRQRAQRTHHKVVPPPVGWKRDSFPRRAIRHANEPLIGIVVVRLPRQNPKSLYHRAEEVGFEPTVALRPQRFSRPSDSSALALLQVHFRDSEAPPVLDSVQRLKGFDGDTKRQ
jgi:hypothetical protein